MKEGEHAVRCIGGFKGSEGVASWGASEEARIEGWRGGNEGGRGA